MMNPQNGSALVEREIIASGAWFIRIRWMAGIGVLAATWVVTVLLAVRLPIVPIYTIGVVILVYNAIFWWARERLLHHQPGHVASFGHMTNWQIGLDYIVMSALVHYTGGLESPVIFYFIFHIIIAAILLSPRTTYLYATFATVLLAATTGLEYAGLLPHIHVSEFIEAELYRNPPYILGKLFFFISTIYTTAYLASTLNIRLRERAAEVIELSQELQRAYRRLETLYESVQAVNSTLEIQQVLERLAEATAKAMRVRACSIRLLDKTSTRLDVVAAYGLSQGYVQKGDLVLERNPLAREVLAGRTIISNDVSQEPNLQYPAEAMAEGIRSMLSAPLRGKSQPLGLIRTYSTELDHFTSEDATFLAAIASQGSIAIENALAYQALGQLDQQKSKFVLTVTHELRSPVSVIRSLLRTMTAGYTGSLSEEQRDMVTRALRRADFLQTLIDDLLDLAAGKSDLDLPEERVHVALDRAIERAIKQFEVSAQEKQVQLEFRCEESPQPFVVAASNEGIDRMIGNLVSNAIKYTPTGGQVRVDLKRVGGDAMIKVCDTGIGIPEESLPHLFEEFYRAPNAKAMQREGTGLGLAITRDLATRYGGRITVESKLGEGTAFTVFLPLEQLPVAEADSHPQ
jgi:signal transduction histidine kinase